MTHRLTLHGTTVALVFLAAVPGRAQPPAPGADDWKYDVVYRKKGEPFKGLVQEQNSRCVEITVISRRPGRPTILFNEEVERRDIESVKLLDPADRDLLHKRVDGLKKERALLAARLKLLDPGAKPATDAADVYSLKPVPWPPEPRQKALSFPSTHYCLVTTARAEYAQFAVIVLEQAYSAYTSILPPRVKDAPPTTILLTGTVAEYQALVRSQGVNFLNPAFFDVTKNQVACGSDLQRLCDELEKIREFHEKRLKELADEEKELKAAYKNKVPPDLLATIENERTRIKGAEERNAKGYQQERRRVFRRLYHEAFHAYLNTFVYPPEGGEMPRWLNEGLAQIFEAAIFEVGGGRIDHAEKEQVDAIRQAIIRDSLPSVAEVVRSGPRQFLVAHSSEKQKADRFYMASWGLAHYLTFGRHVLGTKAMDDYVASLKRGTDPVQAFTTLVGQPLPEFQMEFVEYLKHLRAADSR